MSNIVFILRRSRGEWKVWITLFGGLEESVCLRGVIAEQRSKCLGSELSSLNKT